jgi:uncharacterized cupin superfamily protein
MLGGTGTRAAAIREGPMSLYKPALNPLAVEPVSASSYPEPYRARVMPREKRRLGDFLGLKKIGVNRTTLPPGKESSMRHWHTHEEEFIFVLEGEVVLRTQGGEQVLTAGSCAGFPAGVDDGHQLINRSDKPAVYLEVGSRDAEDTVYYSDSGVDMILARGKMTRRDGTPY